MSLNKLTYTLDPDLSVCVSRTYKTHFFQSKNYLPGATAVCIVNSGADYIDAQNSYLKVTVKNTGARPTSFGPLGSACNLFSRIIITSRSGEEIERVESLNLLCSHRHALTKNTDWFRTVGAAAGYVDRTKFPLNHFPNVLTGPGHEINTPYGGEANPQAATFNSWVLGTPANTLNPSIQNMITLAHAAGQRALNAVSAGGDLYGERFRTVIEASLIEAGESRTFCIPVTLISGLFESTNRLLPSHLMSGLRIDLHLEEAHKALVNLYDKTAGAPHTEANYTIENMELELDSYTLTDSVQRALNEVAATSGLELPYKSHFTTTGTWDPATGGSVEIRKAVSRALGVITTTKYSDTEKTHASHWDSMRSTPFNLTGYQTRVGSLYFPQQATKGGPMTTTSLRTRRHPLAAEAYLQTLRGVGKLSTPSNTPLLSFAQFGSPDFQNFDGTTRVAWQSDPAYYANEDTPDLIDPDAYNTVLVNDNHWCIATDLERSTVQELSGIPVNSSRVIEVSIRTQDLPFQIPDALTSDIRWKQHRGQISLVSWLCYTRLLRVWINSVDVAE